MNLDEFKQLIRMAQILKMRAGHLADGLPTNCGPEKAKARKASELAGEAERKLLEVFNSLVSIP